MRQIPSDLVASLPKLYDAALGADRWTAALDTIADLVPSKGVMAHAFGREESPYSANLSNSLYSGFEDGIREYTARFIHYDVYGIGEVQKRHVFHPIRDTDIWPDIEALTHREDIQFVRQRRGVLRRIYYKLSDARFMSAALILQFDERFSEVPQLAIDRATVIVPHLAKALEINRFFEPVRQRYQAVLSALDRVKVGICVASPVGELIVMNETARQVFETSPGVALDRQGKLVVAAKDVTEKISAAIQSCSRTAAGQNNKSGYEITVPREGGDPLLILVAPLRDSEEELERNYTGCLITLVDPDIEVPIKIEGLQRIHGLTPAETETAGFLVRGVDIETIAENRNISIQTVRTQIRSIYAKMDVSGRHAFMWKAIQILPPVL